jgi:hypothetical protein
VPVAVFVASAAVPVARPVYDTQLRNCPPLPAPVVAVIVVPDASPAGASADQIA